jgi:hypothetical protein
MILKSMSRGMAILRFLAGAIGVVALSSVLTWPLWSLATARPLLYTEISGILIFLLLGYALLHKPLRACLRRAQKRAQRRKAPRI